MEENEQKRLNMQLYSIYAKVKVGDKLTDNEKLMNVLYDGIINRDFRGNLTFLKEPTEEEIIDLLRLLSPNKEYYLGSVRIKYIREYDENE